MNPEDVVHHVCKSFDDFAARATKREAPNNWDGLRDELCKWVFSVETDVAFAGLLHIVAGENSAEELQKGRGTDAMTLRFGKRCQLAA